MDDIVVREYNSRDREGCIELLKKTFPGTSDENTFKWRFEEKKVAQPIIICAVKDEHVVSFNSWIPWDFEYAGEIYTGYQSGESATDANYRGKGIFTKVVRQADKIASERKIDFLFGFPNKVSYQAFLKAGYYPISTYYFYIRPISPLKKRIKFGINFNRDFFADAVLSQPNKITPVFDYNYCKWRYLDNTKEFEIIEYIEQKSRAKFFFRKKKWKWLTELLLLDCQFNNYNKTFVENSIKFIDKSFSKKAVYIRTFFNEHSDRGRALRKYFYIRAKAKFHILIVKPIYERIDNNILLNCNYWDLMPHCVDDL